MFFISIASAAARYLHQLLRRLCINCCEGIATGDAMLLFFCSQISEAANLAAFVESYTSRPGVACADNRRVASRRQVGRDAGNDLGGHVAGQAAADAVFGLRGSVAEENACVGIVGGHFQFFAFQHHVVAASDEAVGASGGGIGDAGDAEGVCPVTVVDDLDAYLPEHSAHEGREAEGNGAGVRLGVEGLGGRIPEALYAGGELAVFGQHAVAERQFVADTLFVACDNVADGFCFDLTSVGKDATNDVVVAQRVFAGQDLRNVTRFAFFAEGGGTKMHFPIVNEVCHMIVLVVVVHVPPFNAGVITVSKIGKRTRRQVVKT
jgi:hypothetical protein